MSAIEQAIAEIATLKREIEIIKAKERPLAVRGWRDDFLGRAILAPYLPASAGVGSGGALVNNFHGGAYRLTAGAGAGRYHWLWLGDGADGFATLDADFGWTMIARMTLSDATNIIASFGATDAAGNNIIIAGLNTAVFANWWLRTRIGGGGVNDIDSGIAADTDPHWHRLDVYPVPTVPGHRVDYFLDGALIATTTVSVPIVAITPRVSCVAQAAAVRYVDLDYWGTIPMNL